MKINNDKIKGKVSSISTSISSFLIPIFQYVPCTAVWMGIMSVPFFAYLSLYFQNPGIFIYDLNFLFRTHEIYIVLFGLTLFIFSLIYPLSGTGYAESVIDQWPHLRRPLFWPKPPGSMAREAQRASAVLQPALPVPDAAPLPAGSGNP